VSSTRTPSETVMYHPNAQRCVWINSSPSSLSLPANSTREKSLCATSPSLKEAASLSASRSHVGGSVPNSARSTRATQTVVLLNVLPSVPTKGGASVVWVVQWECPSVTTSQAAAQNILERSLEQEST